MNKLPRHISRQIKYHRKRLGLTQEQLSELTGIDRRRLSSLENKRRPATPVEVASLKMSLGLSGFSCQLLSRVSPKSETPSRVYTPEGERHFTARLTTARRTYPHLVAKLEDKIAGRPDAGEVVDFLDDLKLDSSLEVLAILKLLASGAQVAYESPAMHGYWGDDIVEPSFYRSIVAWNRPALITESAVLFPQVSMSAGRLIRVDFLVCHKGPEDTPSWTILELDGGGHQPDHSREALFHRVIRLSESDVLSEDFPARLGTRSLRPAA